MAGVIAFDELPPPGTRMDARTLELVWLVPVAVATVAALLTTDRLALVAPLLAVALIPWILQALRRPLPVWAFGILTIGPVGVLLALNGLSSSLFLATTALSVLASRTARPWQLVLVVAVAGLLPFVSVLSPRAFDPGSFYFAIGDLFAVAVGILLGYSLRLAAELREADRRLLAARAQQERTRVARDVHDLVAHSLTVVVLHIGGARRILPTDADKAGHALAQAEQVCRESLDNVRRVVGLLRTDDDPHTPIDDLDTLLQTYQDAGIRLDTSIQVDWEQLQPLTRTLLARVTQEALSNAARYQQPGTPVEFTCARHLDTVTLTISNHTEPLDHATTGGYGLVGLREQVTSAGGTLASQRHETRWQVQCRLPANPAPTRSEDRIQ